MRPARGLRGRHHGRRRGDRWEPRGLAWLGLGGRAFWNDLRPLPIFHGVLVATLSWVARHRREREADTEATAMHGCARWRRLWGRRVRMQVAALRTGTGGWEGGHRGVCWEFAKWEALVGVAMGLG